MTKSKEPKEPKTTKTSDRTSECTDVDYDFFVLTTMINELPAGIASQLLRQVAKCHCSVVAFQKAILTTLSDHLDSVRLSVLAQQFDLDATRQERDTLQKRLDKGFDDSA